MSLRLALVLVSVFVYGSYTAGVGEKVVPRDDPGFKEVLKVNKKIHQKDLHDQKNVQIIPYRKNNLLKKQMENPVLYSSYNLMQRKDTEMVLSKYSPRLNWIENETVLDIGCGPGDVTMEVLMPVLPQSAHLVGIDISQKMIEHANKKYSNERADFKVVDFSTKSITDFLPEQTFSKIFSFYTLHWIKDQKQVFKNIFTLLKPEGHFLALVAPTNNIFLVYKILSQMERWRMYMEDVDKYIPRFYDSADVSRDIEEVVKGQGLEIIAIEEQKRTTSFPNMQVLKQSIEAVNPFVKRMNQSTRELYIDGFEQVIKEQKLISESDTGEINSQNPIIIIYGKRPRN